MSYNMQHPFARLHLDSFRHPAQQILSLSPTAEKVAKGFEVVVHAKIMKNRVWYDCFYYANGQTCAVPVSFFPMHAVYHCPVQRRDAVYSCPV